MLLVGVVRVDNTGRVWHALQERDYLPERIAPNRYAFEVRFNALQLLPGKYEMRVHVLDPEGLRLFDTVEREFVVTGDTRDYGLVELTHEWRRR